jgi:hypothetical protein
MLARRWLGDWQEMTPDVGTVWAEKRRNRGLEGDFRPAGTLREGLFYRLSGN